MNELVKKAEELAKLIKESKEYVNAKETAEFQKKDPKSQELIAEYNDIRRENTMKMQFNEVSQEEMQALAKEMDDAFEKLLEYAPIKEYIDAQNALEELNNQIISIVMGATNEGGCSGSCSSCSGCH